MKIAAIALSLFVAGTAATNSFLDFVEESRFLQEANVTVAYNASLQCGQCIRGGFIGCTKETLSSVVTPLPASTLTRPSVAPTR
jgi:hypothetical protein